jgi:hypothetical protein
LAEIKITTTNLPTELKSKLKVLSNIICISKNNNINFVFLECDANFHRLGQELKVTEENLKKDLRGTIHFLNI